MNKKCNCWPVLIVLFLSVPDAATLSPFQWRQSTPESLGYSGKDLIALKDSLAERKTKSLLIISDDKIILEWYAADHGQEKRHYTASLAKALVGGMSLLLALNDGNIDIDAPLCHYIPELKTDSKKSKITIRQLATHTSGLEDAELDNIPHMQLPGWKGQFWRKEPDPFSVARDSTPVVTTPGTDYAYSNPGMAMLAYAVTASLQKSSQANIRTLLRERIMTPIGIDEDDWSIGYGKTYQINGLPLVANWGGGSFTARAVACVGRLMLRKGNWQGRQLIDADLITESVQYAGMPLPERAQNDPVPASGLCWYTNFDGIWPAVPRDAFAGAGAGNQVLLVVPSLNLIIVRMGGNLYNASQAETSWGSLNDHLFTPVMNARISPPYPASDIISEVHFAKPAKIVREAHGSDNWPVTWADDNALYTAYGDGWGFEPRTEIKLSMGLAKITGDATDFTAENIRSLSGERVGQGKYGPKASGMLMVDGILYMLVRNTGNSRIAWSEDKGKNWQWCSWRFETSFGHPTFLNFGKNYQGARDNYIYIYSHDSNSAYQPADEMVLARVNKNEILDRRAYTFYSGMNEDGDPAWSIDIRVRAPVFKNAAQCYRSGISYNDGLKRYIWCQIIPGEAPRFEGGFGIYEAPEPWGPWRTLYYTRKWDVGPGENMSLPTKWLSKDGQTGYLLFSGEDAFSVRKVTFKLK